MERNSEMDNFDNLLKRERFKALIRIELLKRGLWPTDGPGDHSPTFYASNGKKTFSIEAVPQRLHGRGIQITQVALNLEEMIFIVGVFVKKTGINWLILTREEMREKCHGNLGGDGRYKFRIPSNLKGWEMYHDRWDILY